MLLGRDRCDYESIEFRQFVIKQSKAHSSIGHMPCSSYDHFIGKDAAALGLSHMKHIMRMRAQLAPEAGSMQENSARCSLVISRP